MLRFAALSIAVAISAYGVVTAQSASSQPKQKEFVIRNDDGYGTSDCLSKASACGKIVADAWCEAKGFGKAVAFRPVEPTEITNSTGRSSPVADAFLISCSE
ncbi:MAG TPA: hypothetical protein PK812_10945 [Beijerinckiaceae bacterium]|nr:hypothetical protein [Beijerinckiaceae bacterium]